jgi:hypothetical protein
MRVPLHVIGSERSEHKQDMPGEALPGVSSDHAVLASNAQEILTIGSCVDSVVLKIITITWVNYTNISHGVGEDGERRADRKEVTASQRRTGP